MSPWAAIETFGDEDAQGMRQADSWCNGPNSSSSGKVLHDQVLSGSISTDFSLIMQKKVRGV
jgi:hypothetical protein